MPGRVNGKLKPPPASPNCCTSVCDPNDATHYIEPLRFAGEPSAAKARLKQILDALPRTRCVSEDDTYLHYTFTTPVLRFTDDVEFLFDDEGVIHVRSCSRVGYSDLGANRRRIEHLRGRWDD